MTDNLLTISKIVNGDVEMDVDDVNDVLSTIPIVQKFSNRLAKMESMIVDLKMETSSLRLLVEVLLILIVLGVVLTFVLPILLSLISSSDQSTSTILV
jgi:hypothetical protein